MITVNAMIAGREVPEKNRHPQIGSGRYVHSVIWKDDQGEWHSQVILSDSPDDLRKVNDIRKSFQQLPPPTLNPSPQKGTA